MRPTFEKTIDILVKAYLNDTLEHQNCAACAVGNLIAFANNIQLLKVPPYGCMKFTVKLFRETDMEHWFCPLNRVLENNMTRRTGYTSYELALIEEAFESVAFDPLVEDKVYEGLMKVVSVLASIHNVDLSAQEEAKLLFAK